MTTSRIPAGVQAVFFDAVGTLLAPDPSAAAVYHEVGRSFGSSLDLETVRVRFVRAFLRQEQLDRVAGWRTDEGREEQRWRAIVAEVLDDVRDGEGCFQALYEHFARPEAWRCDPEAGAVLGDLAARGYLIGMASNFDHRLHGLVEGLPDLAPVRLVTVSSEVGWRKPAPEFFAALCQRAGLPPERVLLVGDDLDNDLLGARAAGLRALLLDPEGQWAGPAQDQLRRLVDLLEGGGMIV